MFKLYNAEYRVRDLSSKYKNTYIVGVNACCREIYNPKFYLTLVVAKSKAEA